MRLFVCLAFVLFAVYLTEGKSVVEEKPKGKPEAKKAPEPAVEVTPEQTKTASYGNTDLEEASDASEDETDFDNEDEDSSDAQNALDRSHILKKDVVVASHHNEHHHHGCDGRYEGRCHSCYDDDCYHCCRKRRLLYHMYMTPTWMKAHAAYIDTTSEINNEQLRFIKYTNRMDPRLLQVNLVAANVLKDDEPITVEITVAMSTTLGTYRDSDIRYVLSDGEDAFGVETCDRTDYRMYTPCYGIQAKSGESMSKMSWINRKRGRAVYTAYPAEFTFRFKTQERWGSCQAGVPGGYANTFHYSRKLQQSKGIKLEVYKQGKGEQVGIKYLMVTVRRETY